MDLDRPLGVITPTVDAEVLSVLAVAETSFTGRQVQVIMNSHTQKSVWTALQRLSKQGIVHKEEKGKAGLYSLNRNHLAVPYIIGLANLKNELLARIVQMVSEWEMKSEFVALFGSAAWGGMHPDSDIDLFIVRPDAISPDQELWTFQVAALTDSVTNWTGNDARILELSMSEVRKDLEKNEKILTDIRDQSIVLLGQRSFLKTRSQAKPEGEK